MKKVLLKISAWAGVLALGACNNLKEEGPETPDHDTTHRQVHDTTNVDTTYAVDRLPNQARYFYEPDTSVITGKLRVEMFYGPPGYGENPEEDMKEETYLLWLDQPVKVFSNSPEQEEEGFNTTKQEVDKIQLMSTHDIQFKSYEGKTIQVRGSFFGAHTGHHHAEVLMDVNQLVEVK